MKVSKYTEKLVTEQAALAEIVLERQNKNIKLPKHFWNDERWARNFKTQLRFAIQLLRIYCYEAIESALESKQGKNIYSLSAKWLDPLIKQEQSKIDTINKAKEVIKESNSDSQTETSLNLPLKTDTIIKKSKTLFSKLNED